MRARNDDAFLIDGGLGLALVADGVGTRFRGDLAARLSVRVAREALRLSLAQLVGVGDGWRSRVEELVRDAVQRANTEVYHAAEALSDGVGMASTLDVVLVRQGFAFVGHVGDSRTWLVRDGQARLLTEDHTVAAEQARRGVTPRGGSRSMLQRALGLLPSGRVDLTTVPVSAGDVLVVCTDGLGRYVNAEEIAAIVVEEQPSDRLVGLARARGGGDNITVVTAAVGAVVADADVDDLRRFPGLAGLTNRELQRLQPLLNPREARAGTLVCREGAPGSDLYLLRDGEVAVTCGGAHVATLGPGGVFGVLDERDGATQPASALATKAASLWVLPRARRVQLAHQDEGVALAVWRELAPHLPRP